MKSVLEKFDEALTSLCIRKYTDTAERIIVAFSGGADSCLLLHLTCKYFLPKGIIVECAHLNHMIRGDEADRDENFCREIAEKLGVRLHLKRADIPALTKNGGSVEDVARRERYAFFSELTSGSGSTVVFTAHNADDNLETVLFNLVRGASINGLCGIPPVRDETYLRPLLTFSSAEIREICKEHRISYVTDSTNLQSDYTRNFIRNNVVKSLRKVCPTPEAAVLRMSASLRTDSEYLDKAAEQFIHEYCNTSIPNLQLAELHEAVLSRVILKKYAEAAGDGYSAPKLEKIHVDLVISRLRKSPNERFSLSLPGGIEFFSEYGQSRFRHKSKALKSSENDELNLELDVPVEKNGFVILLTKNISKFYEKKEENIYNLSIYKALKFDKIKDNLKIRVRTDGDIFRFGGMSHKVKKLFSDKKMPIEERQSIPIVCDKNGIVWIPGFPLRDGLADGNGEVCYLCCFK